jgi:hypothetical protein
MMEKLTLKKLEAKELIFVLLGRVIKLLIMRRLFNQHEQ